MSRSTTRVVLSVLLSLAVVAAVYTVVYGAALHPGVSSARTNVTAGLMPDLSHVRSTGQAAPSLAPYYDKLYSDFGEGHDCERNSNVSPND